MPAAPRTPAPKKTGFGRKTPHGVLEVDWPFFGEMCRALALKIFRDYDPDVVIGIARAGDANHHVRIVVPEDFESQRPAHLAEERPVHLENAVRRLASGARVPGPGRLGRLWGRGR